LTGPETPACPQWCGLLAPQRRHQQLIQSHPPCLDATIDPAPGCDPPIMVESPRWPGPNPWTWIGSYRRKKSCQTSKHPTCLPPGHLPEHCVVTPRKD